MKIRKRLRWLIRWLQLVLLILILKTVMIAPFKLNHFKATKLYTPKYIPNREQSIFVSGRSMVNPSNNFPNYSQKELYRSSNNATVFQDCGDTHVACLDGKTCCPADNTCCPPDSSSNGFMKCCPAGIDVSYHLMRDQRKGQQHIYTMNLCNT